MDKTQQRVMIIRTLYEKGYRQKLIQIITQYNQSYISKIINQKLHQGIILTGDIELVLDENQKERLNAVNKIISCDDIFTDDFNQEIIYMKLLRFFLIEKEQIYNLYNYISKRRINSYLLMKGLHIKDFKPELLDIKKETYFDMIVDYI